MCRYFLPTFDIKEEKLLSFRLKVREMIHHYLPTGHLNPASTKDVLDYMKSNLGTKAAGFPYFKKKGYILNHYRDDLLRRVGFFRNDSYPDGDGPYVMSGTRTTKHGKMRGVWMYPTEAIIVEMMYALPLIRLISSVNRKQSK
jgi:hypothetical protein